MSVPDRIDSSSNTGLRVQRIHAHVSVIIDTVTVARAERLNNCEMCEKRLTTPTRDCPCVTTHRTRISRKSKKSANNVEDEPDLLFVTYTSLPEIYGGDISSVRSHVRRNLRNRRLKKEKLLERDQGVRELAPKNPKVTAPVIFGEGRVDPFSSTALPMNAAMNRLLDHFARILSPLHYPAHRDETANPMTTIWTTAAISDAALFHSTLSSSGTHLSFLERIGRQTIKGPVHSYDYEILKHKGKTIQIINKRLADAPQAVTDETMAAICLIMTNQAMGDGDFNEMAVHMRGLAQLVELRGGLPSLGMNGLLAAEIQWCDNVVAALTSSRPYFPRSEIDFDLYSKFGNAQLDRIFTNGEQESRKASALLWSTTLRELLPHNVIQVFKDIHLVTNVMYGGENLSINDMLVYDRKRAIIQSRLVSIMFPDLPWEIHNIVESCLAAGTIYCELILWGFQPPLIFYGRLARILQNSLQKTDLSSHWNALSSLLVWALFIGGLAALDEAERGWYVVQLAALAQDLHIRDFKDANDILTSFLNHKNLYDSFSTLWDEVELISRVAEDISHNPTSISNTSAVDIALEHHQVVQIPDDCLPKLPQDYSMVH